MIGLSIFIGLERNKSNVKYQDYMKRKQRAPFHLAIFFSPHQTFLNFVYCFA